MESLSSRRACPLAFARACPRGSGGQALAKSLPPVVTRAGSREVGGRDGDIECTPVGACPRGKPALEKSGAGI